MGQGTPLVFSASKLPALSFDKKIFSFSRVLWCSFPISTVGKTEITDPIFNVNKRLILSLGLDENIDYKYNAVWFLTIY